MSDFVKLCLNALTYSRNQRGTPVMRAAPTISHTPISDHMRANGAWNPAWDDLAALDPQWTEKFMDMGATPIMRGVLDPKTYELIAIAVDASCTHMYAPGVRRHIRKALDLGASKDEILAVLQCVAVLGIHSCALGVPILIDELRAHTQDRKA